MKKVGHWALVIVEKPSGGEGEETEADVGFAGTNLGGFPKTLKLKLC